MIICFVEFVCGDGKLVGQKLLVCDEPAWRRVGLYLVYGAIVAYALLSHKRKAVQDET